MKAVIHCQPSIAWQSRRAAFFVEGFRKAGIPCDVTSDRFRHDGFPVLLGTTCWRDIEATGDYLLIDRCSFGDTDKFVSLVWNGHGRRGEHKCTNPCPSRWERIGLDLVPWREGHSRVVLCGQIDTWSPHYARPEDWYATVSADYFRPHPAGYSTLPYPIYRSFKDSAAITLNSSIGVQCVLDGIPTVAMDEGSMAWDVTSRTVEDWKPVDRLPWCHWLAWTQWSDEEIRQGDLWASLW